jgi:hypothetical protein
MLLTVFTICSIESCNTVTLVVVDKVCTSSIVLTRLCLAVIDIYNQFQVKPQSVPIKKNAYIAFDKSSDTKVIFKQSQYLIK